MKSTFKLLTLVLILIFAASCQKMDNTPQTNDHFGVNLVGFENGEIIPGRYIVRFNSNEMPALQMKADMPYSERVKVVADVAMNIQTEITGESMPILHAYTSTIQGFASDLSDAMVRKLIEDPRIQSIEPDRVVALAPPPGKGPNKGGDDGGGESPSQEIPWGITAVGGGSTTASGKTAWIIDSGIDLNHEDLNVDVQRSETFLGGKTTPDDQNGHGTHVAGTVAAFDNSVGVVGVAPGTTVVSVRVLDRRGSGSYSGVTAGVDYVGANAASGDVANMSLGGGVSPALDAAVIAASNPCWFVLAAGNESDDAANHSPARANGSYIYTIAAMTSSNTFASFSNYGAGVDYIEPGVGIKSCWKNGGYNTISGTSMAAPHMAGILLLGTPVSKGTVSTTVGSTTYTYTIGGIN